MLTEGARRRWSWQGEDRRQSHSQSDTHALALPCHLASPVSLILVTNEFGVWALPGLGAGRETAM